MDHNQYWQRTLDAATGVDGEPSDLVGLNALSLMCGEFVKTKLGNDPIIHDAFKAIFELWDRTILQVFLESVEDPKIIRIIHQVHHEVNARIGDAVNVILAGNPHTPLDVLESITESIDENEEGLVEEALKNNPAAQFLFA